MRIDSIDRMGAALFFGTTAMANFRRNPLYRKASRKVQTEARREWRKSTASQTVKVIRQAMQSGRPSSGGGVLRTAMEQWGGNRGGVSRQVMQQLLGAELGPLAREVERYAKSSGSAGQLLREFLGQLGPLGSLLLNVGRNVRQAQKAVDADVQAALEFLDAVAPDTLSRTGRSRARGPQSRISRDKPSAAAVADQIEAARELLESQGYEVKPPPASRGKAKAADDPATSAEEARYPGGQTKTTGRGTPRKIIELEIGGSRRRFPVTHPIVTKEMVRTPESSNVYAYSYDYDTETLFVRYQQNARIAKGGPGSLYAYSNVPPEVFLKMYQAPSKGTFIWDNVRIRGTVSGHRYDYRLVAVRNSYVPRKATLTPSGEMYLQRSVRVKNEHTGKIRRLTSGGDMHARPFRAPPNRGAPNRGR